MTVTRSAPPAAPAPIISLLEGSPWQMSFGERAALEGILSQLTPDLALELGTAEGGSLERLAHHSSEVHSFDLLSPSLPVAELAHVHCHAGDSRYLLPAVLESFVDEGRNVDFALVDGDHSEDGVRRDVQALLESRALGRSVIVLHDTMNETVRRGLERVRFDSYPKVAYVELDFVAGQLFREPTIKDELWGGLGLVLCDAARQAYFSPGPYQQRYYETYELVRAGRDSVVAAHARTGL